MLWQRFEVVRPDNYRGKNHIEKLGFSGITYCHLSIPEDWD